MQHGRTNVGALTARESGLILPQYVGAARPRSGARSRLTWRLPCRHNGAVHGNRLEVIYATWRDQAQCDQAFRSEGWTIDARSSEDSDDWWARVFRIGPRMLLSLPEFVAGSLDLDEIDDDLTDPLLLRKLLGDPRELRGPADLLFFDPAELEQLAMKAGDEVREIAASDPSVARLLAQCKPEEASESGIENVTSSLSVLRDGPDVIAASGWQTWNGAVAHLSVLNHPDYRGKRLSRHVAAHATHRAISAGLLPQWRSREGNDPSIALAHSLGYDLGGRQLSFRMGQQARPLLTRDTDSIG